MRYKLPVTRKTFFSFSLRILSLFFLFKYYSLDKYIIYKRLIFNLKCVKTGEIGHDNP